MRRRRERCWSGAAICCVLATVGHPAWTQEPPRDDAPPDAPSIAQERLAVTVTLQAFSGTPNPQWALDDPADLARLRALLEELPATAPFDEPPFGGVRRLADAAVVGFPARVLVGQGAIKVTRSPTGEPEFYEDAKGLRTFLLSEASRRGLLPEQWEAEDGALRRW